MVRLQEENQKCGKEAKKCSRSEEGQGGGESDGVVGVETAVLRKRQQAEMEAAVAQCRDQDGRVKMIIDAAEIKPEKPD